MWPERREERTPTVFFSSAHELISMASNKRLVLVLCFIDWMDGWMDDGGCLAMSLSDLSLH